MNALNKVFDYYNKLIGFLPPYLRVVVAVVIILVLIFSFVKFIKKNFVWVIIFFLLLPAVWPSLKVIWNALLSLSQKIPK